MKELMVAVAESYEETGELKLTAEEFLMSDLKVRKLLITAGAYSSEISDEINMLYTKMVYKPEEFSLNTERLDVFWNRQGAVKILMAEKCGENLWDVVVAFQKYPFHTVSGLPFGQQEY